MINDTTRYTILDENDEKTTIKLEKPVAVVLRTIYDVPLWVQRTYNRVTKERPELSRRKKGNLVRTLSMQEAEKSPRYKELLNDLLGI